MDAGQLLKIPHPSGRALRSAFALNPCHRDMIVGKTIGLCDDVMTPGATVNAGVDTLTKVGATGVMVLTLARTV